MKSLTITCPNEIFAQTVDALAYYSGYQDVEIDNDNIKLEFAKEQLIALLGDRLKEYAKTLIRQAAQIQIQETIELTVEQISSAYPTISIEIKDA